MELIRGKELSEAILDQVLSPRDAIELTRQLAEALEFAHARGILHRDIKPRNALVDWHGRTGSTAQVPEPPPPQEGTAETQLAPQDADTSPTKGSTRAASACLPGLTAKLFDFGLAKFAEREVQMSRAEQGARSLRTLTRSGDIVGTPSYMSPEQVTGAADLDARTDIYSLGASLYEILTGSPPFHEAATLAELLHLIRNQDPDSPRKRDPDLDADLETICLKCLEKERKDRYQTAGEVAEDCRRYLAGEPIAARPVGPVARLWKRAKRNKAVAIPVAALAVLILGSGIFFGLKELFHRIEVACLHADIEQLRNRREYGEAVRKALLLAEREPEDEDVKQLLKQVQSEQAVAKGDGAFAKYLAARDRTDALEEKEKKEKKQAEAAKRHDEKREYWKLLDELHDAEQKREEHFATAVSAYGEAVAFWGENPHARERLGDLYWDRYLRAEHKRNVADQRTYKELVRQFAWEKYEAPLRGEKEVSVTFLLPESFAVPQSEIPKPVPSLPVLSEVEGSRDPKSVTAYLFRYELNKTPPILVPVPADPATGDALAEGMPTLPPAEPFPLAQLESGTAAGEADLSEEQLAELTRRAGELVGANRYAEAIPCLMVLAHAIQASPTHAYNLACCLAVGGA